MATSSSSSSQRVGGGGRELQGPRPAPLKVRKDSHKITKPQQSGPAQVRQPVIIYTVSPKVVHTNPGDFMSVVQRLTGAPSSSLPAAPPPVVTFPFFAQQQPSSSTLPPAPQPLLQFPFQSGPHEGARLAAIEQARSDAAEGLPSLPSILSPMPGSLPGVPPNFFSSPAGGVNLFGELISPAFLGHYNPLVGDTPTNTAGGGANPMLHLPGAPSPSPSGAGAYYWDPFNSINQQQYHPNTNPNPNPDL